MAYMNQEKKSAIAAALKTVVPQGWKYTLRVQNHMEIVMVIREAPVDFLGLLIDKASKRLDECTGELRLEAEADLRYFRSLSCLEVNPHRLDETLEGDLPAIFRQIFTCLNLGNWNRSDVQSDYIDVGHYVSLKIGEWDKPYRYRAEKAAAQAA